MNNNLQNNKDSNSENSDFIKKFLTIQENEIEYNREKLIAQSKRDELNYKLATEQLKAQLELQKKLPYENRKSFRTVAIFVILIILVLLGLAIYMMERGYIKELQSLGTHLASIILSLIAGNYYGRNKKKSLSDENE